MQEIQDGAPALLNEPAAQGRHVVAPVALYVPAAQGRHVVAPVVLYVPAAQLVQNETPATLLNVPAAHDAQELGALV
jgi:hypothetical protein